LSLVVGGMRTAVPTACGCANAVPRGIPRSRFARMPTRTRWHRSAPVALDQLDVARARLFGALRAV